MPRSTISRKAFRSMTIPTRLAAFSRCSSTASSFRWAGSPTCRGEVTVPGFDAGLSAGHRAPGARYCVLRGATCCKRALSLRRMRTSIVLCAVAAVLLSGCSDAPDYVTGGDPLIADPCQPGGANSGGSRWQDLYACYFGPSGPGSCGGLGSSCHGSSTSTGGPFFVCGQTADACWQGLVAKSIVPDGGATDPTTTQLYLALHKEGASLLNNMPRSPSVDKPTYTFSAPALAQISKWIQQGAQNN